MSAERTRVLRFGLVLLGRHPDRLDPDPVSEPARGHVGVDRVAEREQRRDTEEPEQ